MKSEVVGDFFSAVGEGLRKWAVISVSIHRRYSDSIENNVSPTYDERVE